MKRVNLDTATPAIKKFIQNLLDEPDGVELELSGNVVGKLFGPHHLTDEQKDALLQNGWNLVRKAQERNKGVPSRVIEKEVVDAVDEVRRRTQS